MKKIFLSLSLFTALALVAAPFSFAVTPLPTPKVSPSPKTSPSSSPSVSPVASPQTQEDTAQKLRDLIKQGTDRVKGAMDQVGIQQRGFIGEVQRVTEQTVSVKNLKDNNEILTITSEVIVTRDGKKATIDDIAIGDWVAVLGTTDRDVFTLKKLLVSSTTLQPKELITVLATTKTVTKTQLTASVRNSTDVVTYAINKNTLYQDNLGNKIDPKLVKPDFQYLLVGYKDATGITLTTIRTLGS